MPAPLTVSRNNYHNNKKNSSIYTPYGVIDFIYSIIPEKYFKIPLDPACGDFRFIKNKGIGFDTKMEYDIPKDIIFRKIDFLDKDLIAWDEFKPSIILCNPPFNHEKKGSRKLLPEEFLKLIFKRWNEKIPVVLITPCGFRNNQYRHSSRWKWLYNSSCEISSIISLPLDIFSEYDKYKEYKGRIKLLKQNKKYNKEIDKNIRKELNIILFPTEIICFNIPELKSHYWLPGEYNK